MKILLKQTGIAALYGLLIFLDDRYIGGATTHIPFEPASGLAVAVLLVGGMRYVWGLLIGAILANMMEAPFMLAAITAAADVLEGLGAAWLLTRIGKFDAALGTLRDYLRLILFSAASIAIAGSIWSMALIVGGFMHSAEYWHEWLHWWLGDMLGIILLAPLILVWWPAKSKVARSTKKISEAILLFGLTFLAGQIIFFGWLHDSIGNLARGYVMFLFVVWAAARLGTHGTVAIINLIGIHALFGMLHGDGYFSDDLDYFHQSNYWFYMTILSIVGMALTTFLNGQEQAKKGLKQSEEEFERFFNLIPDMACIASTNGYFRKINRAWQTVLGYTEQEILSTPFLELIHPDDREATLNEVTRQLAGGKSMRFCNRYHCKDGSYRLLEWDMIPPVDGELLYGSARDITERKQFEDELRLTKERYDYSTAIGKVGTWDWDPVTGILVWSDETYRLMGFAPGSMTPTYEFYLELVHPDDRETLDIAVQAALHNRVPYDLDCRIVLGSGEERVCHVTGKVEFDANGQPIRMLGTIQDITERKQAEIRLQESEERLQGIINNTSAVVFMKDTAGSYLLINARYEKLFHISNAAIQGKTDYDLFPKEIADALIQADRKAIQAGRSIEVEEEIIQDDGAHTYISVKFPLHDASGNIYAVCGIATDITERKAAEVQMRDLAAHTVEVREEEKIRIAREVHDELGSMLAALNIDTHWLLRRLSAQDNVSALVERIKSMSQRIDGAVHATRRIIDNLRPAVLDDLGLLAAIEWLAEDFQARTGIECKVKCIADEANLDKQHSIALFRIFQEALTNIVRHSSASRVEVEFHHSASIVTLAVTDNGCGKFGNQATDSKSYGMLGMQERARQLGGSVTFSQPPDGGLCVKAVIPLSATEKVIQ